MTRKWHVQISYLFEIEEMSADEVLAEIDRLKEVKSIGKRKPVAAQGFAGSLRPTRTAPTATCQSESVRAHPEGGQT